MATEAGTARPGSVAMETTPELGASPAQNPAEPLCEAGAAVAAARWDLRKYSLLIVIGDIGTESQLRAVRAHLEQGVLSWNIDLSSVDLNQQLRLFITRHLAHFSSEVKAKQKHQDADTVKAKKQLSLQYLVMDQPLFPALAPPSPASSPPSLPPLVPQTLP